MPIIDLVTPWAADPRGFATRAHPAIETIRRQRSPTEAELPPPASFDGLTARARDPSFQQRLLDTRSRLVDRGFVAPARILLVASAAPGSTAEPLPTTMVVRWPSSSTARMTARSSAHSAARWQR